MKHIVSTMLSQPPLLFSTEANGKRLLCSKIKAGGWAKPEKLNSTDFLCIVIQRMKFQIYMLKLSFKNTMLKSSIAIHLNRLDPKPLFWRFAWQAWCVPKFAILRICIVSCAPQKRKHGVTDFKICCWFQDTAQLEIQVLEKKKGGEVLTLILQIWFPPSMSSNSTLHIW